MTTTQEPQTVYVLMVAHDTSGHEVTLWSNKEAAMAARHDAIQDDAVLWADVEETLVRDVFPVA